MLAMLAELLGSGSEVLWLFAVPRTPPRRHVTIRQGRQLAVVPLAN